MESADQILEASASGILFGFYAVDYQELERDFPKFLTPTISFECGNKSMFQSFSFVAKEMSATEHMCHPVPPLGRIKHEGVHLALIHRSVCVSLKSPLLCTGTH